MLDLRDKLPRAAWEIGRRHGPPTGATLHYNGPPVAHAGVPALEQLQLAGDARFHMKAPAAGGLGADGIQYHYAVLSDGTTCQLRDESAVLWHCANAVGNNQHISVHLPLGGAQDATPAQWRATTDLFADLARRYGWAARSAVLGHREWPRSDGRPQKSCPGPILFKRLQQWRGALAADACYRVAVDSALIREGPGQQYRVALGGTAKLPRGSELTVGAIVNGTPPAGSTDGRWLWLRSGVGFVHISLGVPC